MGEEASCDAVSLTEAGTNAKPVGKEVGREPAAAPAAAADPRLQGISDAIRVVPHFPKQGIMFNDITTLLLRPRVFKDAVDLFVERYRGMGIDAVAGFSASSGTWPPLGPRDRTVACGRRTGSGGPGTPAVHTRRRFPRVARPDVTRLRCRCRCNCFRDFALRLAGSSVRFRSAGRVPEFPFFLFFFTSGTYKSSDLRWL
uniref:adenine phosphoribosyltransferase n=1 Tax=Zea mays TaxID=4577 RepID=C0P397_MAIZE|nr:unknown [Zea mays]